MNNNHKLVLNSYEELENHLRNCAHWYSTDVGPYDIIGITGLLSALLDNLDTRTHKSEHENLREILSNGNLEFLRKLLNKN